MVAAAEFDLPDDLVEVTINAAKVRAWQIDVLVAYQLFPNGGELSLEAATHAPLSC